MKKMYTLVLFAAICFFHQPAFAAAAKSGTANHEALAAEAVKSATGEWENMSRKEQRAKRKAVKSDLKQAVKDWKKSGADAETLLLVIVAVLLPPLAMALYDGISPRFWISLLLTLLFYLPGLIYTLYIILGGR